MAPCFVCLRSSRADERSSPVGWRLTPLSVDCVIKVGGGWMTGRGDGFSQAVIFRWRGGYTERKRINQNKATKLTTKQPFAPTSKMNCYLELFVPFVTYGATMIFLNAFLFLFVFFCLFLFSLNFSSFEPHKHGSVAPGSPSEGRKKNSLAMYKKEQVKPKMLFLMSFLCCSLVSFFVTVIIWWRFPKLYQITWKLTYIQHMELQTFKETFVTKPCCPS